MPTAPPSPDQDQDPDVNPDPDPDSNPHPNPHPNPATAPTVVVAAALYDGAGRLLAARRSAPVELAGRWELPGGKVEPGETPEHALTRELREELGVAAEPVDRVPGEWPLKPGYVLQVWRTRLLSGTPAPLQDHDDLRWLAPDEIWSVDWLEPDVPAVEDVLLRGRP